MIQTDWSRYQFALTAMYHWLFVPLTLGLSLIVAIMESIWYKTRDEKWLVTTKFWMTLFGINFAVGVATGIILEFEFGTNWSNYSWFVGDIFGAPLAIEGLLAFFMEATFIAVMFFGWKRVSPKFHLTSTWLVWFGSSISALWILVANAWMQNPVGMDFDPVQMRNIMTDFFALFSAVAVNKFFHSIFSGWCLAGVFVISVSCWFLLRKRNRNFAIRSIKIGGWVGLIGIVLTSLTGDGSAVEVAKCQPMKLAAMEGLYSGHKGQELVAFGILNPNKKLNNSEPEYLFDISIPNALSLLSRHNSNAFVPGITDIIKGMDINEAGDTISTISYDERIHRGAEAHEALRAFDLAKTRNDTAMMKIAKEDLMQNYPYFGYGYFGKAEEAIPPIAITFYAFHIMVIIGGYLIVFFLITLFAAYKGKWLDNKVVLCIGILTLALTYICSQSGWVVAEVGRQPWVVQNLLPARAAISSIPTSSVILTFWLFAIIFTVLLIAEISIMLKYIDKTSKTNLY